MKWTESRFAAAGPKAFRLRDEERAPSTFGNQTEEINQTQSKERGKQANGKIKPKPSKT